jgi:hypothetical protein
MLDTSVVGVAWGNGPRSAAHFEVPVGNTLGCSPMVPSTSRVNPNIRAAYRMFIAVSPVPNPSSVLDCCLTILRSCTCVYFLMPSAGEFDYYRRHFECIPKFRGDKFRKTRRAASCDKWKIERFCGTWIFDHRYQ